jgi:hypothetical protein
MTPICTSELIAGKTLNSRFSVSQACGGATITFEIEDTNCGTNQACIDERKVLISKMLQSDTYPSPLFQFEDRIIQIWAAAKDALGQPISGTPIYIRLTDPPDTAPLLLHRFPLLQII